MNIDHSDFEAEAATLKGDYLRQVVENEIGGVPTVLDVLFRCMFMSLSSLLLEGSVLTNLFDPLRHQVDLRKVEVNIHLLGKSISCLISSRQAFMSRRFLDGVQVSAFASLSTFHFFKSSVLRALPLAFTFLPARPSKKTSLKV